MDKKALLIIDVQNYFINKYTKHIPQKIADFIESRQKKFDFILFSQFVNSENSNWVKLSNWHKMFKSPDIDIVPELKKFITKNNLFTKTAFSCFNVKAFKDFVENNKIRKLYICGLDTHACVYSTALTAYELGYDIKIITDLCAASHGIKYHKNALEALKKNLVGDFLLESKSKL